MSDDLTLDVKRAIERNAQVTSVRELERRGRREVKVIKTSVIYELIRRAVDNARRSAGLGEKERRRWVEASQAEFRRLAAAHAAQQRAAEEGAAQRRALEARASELEAALRHAREEAAARAEEVQRLQAQLTRQQAELEEAARAVEANARHRQEIARLQAEVEALRAQQPATRELVTELRAMGETIRALEARNRALAARTTPPALEELLERKMAQLTAEISAKLHSLRAGGGGDASPEAIKRVVQQIFAREVEEALESNLDAIQVKEKEAGGIAANLERLRHLNRKDSSEDSEGSEG